jgi:hypothetical protein|nr:MAG TPA: tail protein [Caudoviricetes sp.]
MASVTLVINFRRSGVGISNTDVEYAESTSNTSAPTAGWQTTAPKWRKGYYIWTRTHVYYTNGKEKITTPMCLSTAKSIDRIEECYYSSTSSTAITGGAWVKGQAPKWVNGRYIWTKSVIYYSDGTSEETAPICVTGAQGPQGPQGKPGKDGKDGTSISINGDASGVYANCAALQAAIDRNPNLWVAGDFPMLVNSSSDASKLKVSHGSGYNAPSILSIEMQSSGALYYDISSAIKGSCYICNGDIYHNNGNEWRNLGHIQGPQGEPGKDGTNAVQYYYHVAWCNTPDNSDNSFSTSCSDGEQYAYMGTCVDTTKDDPETFSAYTWVKIQGEQGEPGASAVSIQMSMPAILHKKSKYASTYSITVKAMRDGELLDIKSSIRFNKSMVVGVIPQKSVSGKIETITVSISANLSANVDMIYEATVDGKTYSYTIPIRTVEDGAAGQKGKDGKNGKRMRGPQSWEELGDGYTFYPLDSEKIDVFDVVEYNGEFYECNKKHAKDSSVTPHDDYTAYGGEGNWKLGTQYSFVATKVLWSAIGQIDFFGSQSINVYGQNNNSRVCLHDGMVEIFGAVNSVVPNIRFGVDPETGYSILSYYDNNGKWLYDIGPNGWDNKTVTKGRLEGFDYLPAHEYLNNIRNYGFTASSQLYELKGFNVDGEEKDMKVAVSKVNLCLFPRFYADDRTELQKHPLQGWEPGFRITAWKKLYQYTAGRKDRLILADSERNLTAELAKQADGKWFASREISNGTKLINLAEGKYVRKGTCVKIGKLPMNSANGSVNSLPAYEFSVGLIDSSNVMSSIEICSQICRSYAGIDINNNLNS